MRKAFKFRLQPTKQQAAAFTAVLNAHRYLYNCALQHRRDAYRMAKVSVRRFDQQSELPAIRREIPGMEWSASSSAQIIIQRVDNAFAAFFRRIKSGDKPGYPRFQGKDRFDSVAYTAGNGAQFTGHTARFFAVGDVRVRQHRPVQGTVKQITLKREADGWYVVLSCDLGDVAVEPATKPAIGIDVGLKVFLATSEGETVDNPRYYRVAQKRLRRAQRSLSRCKRGSNRRKKAIQRVARLHQHVRRQRDDFQYKTVAKLLRKHGAFAIEDLNVKGLAGGMLAKPVHDAAWGMFFEKLTRKAAEAGASVIAVPPRNTTQACSQCGALPDVPLTLRDRVYRCLACGLVLDRDINAARTILKKSGLPEAVGRQREPIGCALSEQLSGAGSPVPDDTELLRAWMRLQDSALASG